MLIVDCGMWIAKMARTAFQNLEIYQLSERLANAVWGTVAGWKQFERDTLGKQLVRAADSVGANIAEGYGRGNGPDHRRFLKIARGSTYEVKHFLRLAFHRGLVDEKEVASLKPILDELPPRLNAYIRAVCRRRSPTINNQQSTIVG